MICERTVIFFCKDYKMIENYEQAMKDTTQTWHCHHRLETHFSDGSERPRNAQLRSDELKALDMYYNRPPEELIFLKSIDHRKLHSTQHSKEARKKMSEANKGKKRTTDIWNKGKHLPEEMRNKISESNKGEKNGFYGRHHTEETRKKLSEKSKIWSTGKHWFNNGEVEKFELNCPEGFVKGRLKSSHNKGKHWKVIDGKCVYY